jgi:hypothetical protein
VEEGPPRAIADLPALWRTARARLDAEAVTGIVIQSRPVGRYTMLASATFFVVKAMVRPAGGTAPATAARVPAGRADDHDAPRATRARGGRSIVRRLRAAVHYGTDGGAGTASRENRRLGRPAQAD